MANPNQIQFYGRTHACRLIGVSMQTLIKYEAAGIVSPQRDSSGKRLYANDDTDRAKRYRFDRAFKRASKRSA